jgi:DNA-binding NtrC family response regulator
MTEIFKVEHSILLVEDDPLHREMLTETLQDRGYAVSAAETGQQAADFLSERDFPVALVDIRLPDIDGFTLFELILARQAECSVLLMTGQATVEAAVDAMKKGAHDYLAKPFRMELLLLKLERLFRLKDIENENRLLRGSTETTGIIGRSAALSRFLATAKTVAGTDATILLQGESGTGKELFAEFIHEHSPRGQAPLIKVNCGAIPETLLEAELFGHEKGAFTGADRRRRGLLEQAHGGTLFLDEIGEIPPAMQVKLLRALQEHRIRRLGSEDDFPVDFRLLAATHRNLQELRESGAIREDFYYRLNVVPLVLPPLRERLEDLPLLIDHFIRRYSRLYSSEPIRFSPEVIEILQQYSFPGNVRELENLVERLQVLHPGVEILQRHLPKELLLSHDSGSNIVQIVQTTIPLRDAMKDFERRFISRVLEEEHGNRTAAARRLGISRKALWEKLGNTVTQT